MDLIHTTTYLSSAYIRISCLVGIFYKSNLDDSTEFWQFCSKLSADVGAEVAIACIYIRIIFEIIVHPTTT
ncbi:MAG: hypothetical protein ACHBN1_22040 [Heteroscytonema crispum UTEX LB 1556]